MQSDIPFEVPSLENIVFKPHSQMTGRTLKIGGKRKTKRIRRRKHKF